jgi:hypothetical protein
MMEHHVRLSIVLFRSTASDDPDSRVFIHRMQSVFGWRSRSCICCDRRLKRPPTTFVAVYSPEDPTVAIAFAICRRCERLGDTEILQAGKAAVHRRHFPDATVDVVN